MTAQEGGLQAPTRHPLAWRSPEFWDGPALDREMRRVFDICHGCRRCFNLCDSFPRLFALIDDTPGESLDEVPSPAFGAVVEACTLCDMCYMTKCPYVPPHPFALDFPHLMLRHRAQAFRAGQVPLAKRQIARTDRNGRLAAPVAPLVNWAARTGNRLTRPLMEHVTGIDRHAALPPYHRRRLSVRLKGDGPAPNPAAPGFGRKAVLYATCFGEYNRPEIGEATRAVLAKNGVETRLVYPGCCGMPLLEQGDLDRVAAAAQRIVGEMMPWIDRGYEVIALVPSCALMLRSEWPLLLPDSPEVARLAAATRDVCEYVVDLARQVGLAEGQEPLPGGVAVHLACHARAQNLGPKAVELLRLIPGADVTALERCSGHGGAWGIARENFPVALKVGRPVARKVLDLGKPFLASECPLAALHIAQGVSALGGPDLAPQHPIELMARAYGLTASSGSRSGGIT